MRPAARGAEARARGTGDGREEKRGREERRGQEREKDKKEKRGHAGLALPGPGGPGGVGARGTPVALCGWRGEAGIAGRPGGPSNSRPARRGRWWRGEVLGMASRCPAPPGPLSSPLEILRSLRPGEARRPVRGAAGSRWRAFLQGSAKEA